MASIAERISKALRDGLTHPGDPQRGVKPTPIMLPFAGGKASRPKEMQDLIDGTTKLLSEAIVDLIEQDYEIVPKDVMAALRVADGERPDPGDMIAVHCRCSPDSNPLLLVPLTHPNKAVVEGGALIRGLSKRDVKCPHEWGKR